MNNATYERLVSVYTEEYLQKIYYFCLKKTGAVTEAEDLAQDITLNVLTSLHHGAIPIGFSAWVWQIARNRYSLWADRKHKRAESVTGADIGDYEIEDPDTDPSEQVIAMEELALLRRELAFTAAEYRTIVVAHYLEDKPIREIAAALSLNENTVKQRLFRARNILKEGMNMAREFGVRSYKPEEIRFTNSCSSFGDKGQPWNVLSHALYKNIFLEAYGNPSTAEALSVELGVALPYMEDELAYLVKETFLKKNGSKYETAFPIISREAQQKAHNKNVQIALRLTRLLEEMIDIYYNGVCRTKGIPFEADSYENAKWTLILLAFDRLCYSSEKRFSYTVRPDNGRWDIVGYQNADLPEGITTGLHGCEGEVRFGQYRIYYKDHDKKLPDYLTAEEAEALQAIAKGEPAEKALAERLADYGYVTPTENGYEPAIMVLGTSDPLEEIAAFDEEEKEKIMRIAGEIRALLEEAKRYAASVTAKDLPAIFCEDERMCHLACINNGIKRDHILEQALSDGWLKYDENTSKTIGVYLYI